MMNNTRILPPAPSAYDYQLLIGRILEQPLKYKPDAEIVYRTKSRYSYRDLFKRVSRFANLLTGDLAVQPGETIGFLDYDSHRFLEAYFAIPMTGAVLHTINFRHSEDEILYTINHAEDKIIFCHIDFFPFLDKMRDKIKGVRKIILLSDEEQGVVMPNASGEYEALLSQQEEHYSFPDFDENSAATIFFTTGTTGLPKAVSFSHRQLVLQTLVLTTTLGSLNSIVSIGPDDVYMPLTPMFHVHAWGFPYVVTYLGLKQVYPGKYDPSMLLQLRRDEKVTISHGVPTLLQMICSHPDAGKTDLTNWKIVCGGSELTRELAKKILSHGINVIVGYGMSETGPAISFSYIDQKTINDLSEEEQIAKRLQAGKPTPFSEVRIRNHKSGFQPHDGISQGEIVVRSPWVVSSYFNDPVRSEALWKDGYLHTGDIGSIDKDGNITITDRIKDVIKSGGEWISSRLLESLIATCDGITEVAVVAVPDEKWGERPMAVIVPEPGAKITNDILNQHLQQFVHIGKLKSFAIPKDYLFIKELPRTSVGKIDKKKIRAMIEGSIISGHLRM